LIKLQIAIYERVKNLRKFAEIIKIRKLLHYFFSTKDKKHNNTVVLKKIMMNKNLSIIIVVMVLIIFGVIIYLFKTNDKAFQKQTELQNDPKKFCKTDEDCACGINKETGECSFGNKNFIDTSIECPDFCSGIAGQFKIICKNNQCVQVPRDSIV
jgi:hypothetical protein